MHLCKGAGKKSLKAVFFTLSNYGINNINANINIIKCTVIKECWLKSCDQGYICCSEEDP